MKWYFEHKISHTLTTCFRHLKSASSVSKEVNEFLEDKKSELKVELKKILKGGTRLSIITDEWSSTSGPRYLNVCAKTHDTSYNLGLVQVKGSLTSEKTIKLIETKLCEFGLSWSVIVSLSSDGCATMIKV